MFETAALNEIFSTAEDMVINAIRTPENTEGAIAATVEITVQNLMERNGMNEKAVICYLSPMICRSMEWAVEEHRDLRPIFKGFMTGLLHTCQNESRDPIGMIWYLSKFSLKSSVLYSGNVRDVILGLADGLMEMGRTRNRMEFLEAFTNFEIVCLLVVSDDGPVVIADVREVLEDMKVHIKYHISNN